jgi:PAS domain-containing protein
MKTPLFKIPHLLSAVVPSVYLGLVLCFDWAEPFRTVTPPLCAMGLLFMATLLLPLWMCWWATVYSVVVVEVLLNPKLFSFLSNGYVPPEVTSHKFRVAGFLCTALFCCIFSYLLTKLRRKRAFLNHLIARMPIPVVLSDAQGRILLLNDGARELLGISSEQKNILHSYFDLLAPKSHQGRCISSYIGIFKEGTERHDRIELEISGKPVTGTVELLDSRPKQLITMLARQPE